MINKKLLELDNGIQALLISDHNANKTSLAFDIRSGSMGDPVEHQGLSHLVEHMLFKGSEQHPDGNLFSSILYSNQGIYSAVTGAEHSTYAFEVATDSFSSALSVFAGFFKKPIFKAEDIFGEISLIDNEFSFNRKDPDQICSHLLNNTSLPGHPISKFFHGNAKSLKNVKQDIVEEYFTSYIRAPKKLVICGRQTIQEMEELVLLNFLQVPNSDIKAKFFDSSVFDHNRTPDVINVELIDGRPFLRLCFQTCSMYELFRTKPNWIVNFLLNSERSGSLVDLLKRKDLAEGLWSSFQNFSFSSFLNIDVMLTSKGLSSPFDISSYIFSYLDLLRKEGYKDYIYKEQKNTAEAGLKFKEHREGLLYTKGLARNMHYYGPLSCEENAELIYEYSDKDFHTLMDELTPQKVRHVVYGSNAELNRKDKYYGINFSYSDHVEVKKIITQTRLVYPDPNVFIAEDFSHVEDDGVHYPKKIIDDSKGLVWFMNDWQLGLPYTYINLLILNTDVNAGPKEKLNSIIYTKMLNESLGDISDMAGEAGLAFGIERSDRGITTYFAGYSDKILVLFRKVVEVLGSDLKDKDLLARVKRNLKSDYAQLDKDTSYSVAQYYKYDLIHKTNINYLDYLKLIDDVSLADINSIRKAVFSKFAVESYIYGNISAEQAIELVNGLFKTFKPKELCASDKPKDLIVKCPRGSSRSYSVQCKSNDSCWASFFDFGQREIRLSAVIQLGFGFLKGFFFDQMRNKRNLGYVVESRLDFFEHVLGISFVVCSESSKALSISAQAANVLEEFIPYLESLSIDELESSRRSLMAGVSKNNKTIEEWMSELILTATVHGDPDYGKKLCKEIESVSIQELISVFSSKLCGTDVTSISVLVDGVGSKSKYNNDTAIIEMSRFKKEAVFYQ